MSVGGRIWEELRKGATPEAVAREQEGILSGMDAAFTALDRLQTAALSFEVSSVPSISPARAYPALGAHIYWPAHKYGASLQC